MCYNDFEDLDERKFHERYWLRKQVFPFLLEHIKEWFYFLKIYFWFHSRIDMFVLKKSVIKIWVWELHIHKYTLVLKKLRLIKRENITDFFKNKEHFLSLPLSLLLTCLCLVNKAWQNWPRAIYNAMISLHGRPTLLEGSVHMNCLNVHAVSIPSPSLRILVFRNPIPDASRM